MLAASLLSSASILLGRMVASSLASYHAQCLADLRSCSLTVAATGEESSDSDSQTDSDATPRDSLTEAMPCTTPPFPEFPEAVLNLEFGRYADKSAVIQLLEEELHNERASSELLATLVPTLIWCSLLQCGSETNISLNCHAYIYLTVDVSCLL